MKILIVSSDTKSLIDFRSDLMKDMINQGHEVIAVAPENEFLDTFQKMGVKFCRIEFERASANPLNDIKFYRKIVRAIKREKPDLVFSYAIKPVIYASIAAKRCKVKAIYSLLPGLGYAFSQMDGIKDRILKKVVIWLLKLGCKYNEVVFVQNPDDRIELISKGILSENKCIRVNSSGVNLTKFVPVERPPKPIFIMVARLLKDKGLFEYINAARYLKQKYEYAEFLLLGPFDANPTSVKENELKELISDGCVNYLGEVNDVRPILTQTSVFVLPSYYREGVPRSVQEAMAMGRAIITTDWIGCRETVKDQFNGLLVKPKDTNDLINKMEYFIRNPDEINRMGENSIKYCLEKFDVKIINEQMLSAMNMPVWLRQVT